MSHEVSKQKVSSDIEYSIPANTVRVRFCGFNLPFSPQNVENWHALTLGNYKCYITCRNTFIGFINETNYIYDIVQFV